MLTPDKIKILVVDDDAELHAAVVDFFKLFHFNVSSATNGEEALALVRAQEFHVVLTDMRMPKMNGLQLIQEIRKINLEKPKVLVLTGYTDLAVSELYAAGADGFFPKPYNAALVRTAVQMALLNRTERWSLPLAKQPERQLNLQFKSLQNDPTLKFGQNGFLLKKLDPTLSEGDVLNFNFEFSLAEPLSVLRGVGIVRWRDSSGVGVEIQQIDPAMLRDFANWVAGQRGSSVIPSN